MNDRLSNLITLAIPAAMLILGAVVVQAQGRAGTGDEIVLKVRKLEGIGRKGEVQTPNYATSMRRSTRTPGDWARIRITFDTSLSWLDEVAVQYYALLVRKEDGQNKYLLCRQSDVYIDVPRGKDHMGAVYIRPNALKRWGQVVAVAAVVEADGRMQAEVSDAAMEDIKKSGKWWENAKLETKEGILLRRSATPFAFINVDDYGVSRQ